MAYVGSHVDVCFQQRQQCGERRVLSGRLAGTAAGIGWTMIVCHVSSRAYMMSIRERNQATSVREYV